jgi:hypothetical protein
MPGPRPRTRILLDQNTPLGLRRFLTEHDVVPARSMGWAMIENGALIKAAEEAGLAILITWDQIIRYQQNLTGRQIAVIELTTSIWPAIRTRLDDVIAAVQSATLGSYITITFPRPPKRRRPFNPPFVMLGIYPPMGVWA